MDWLLQLLSGLGPGAAMGAEAPGLGAAANLVEPNFGVPPTNPSALLPPTATPVAAPPMPMPRPAIAGQDMTPGPVADLGQGPVPIPMPRPSNIPSLGESLEPSGSGVGKPLDIRPPAQQAQGMAPGGPAGDKILAALKGVQAPPKPDVVKPSTPAAPMPKATQAGDFFALLQALSNPRAAAGGPPMTLGGSLGTGRY